MIALIVDAWLTTPRTTLFGLTVAIQPAEMPTLWSFATPAAEVVAAAALMTPEEAVIVELSTLARPKTEDEVFWIAGAPSERMNVVAEPLTATSLAVALGLAPAGRVCPRLA